MMAAVAVQAEEFGLDVLATGEHHNPPFVPSPPPTLLGYIAARTSEIVLSTSTTPEATLERIEILGTVVVPVLRKEMEAVRRPDVPDAPRHPSAPRA